MNRTAANHHRSNPVARAAAFAVALFIALLLLAAAPSRAHAAAPQTISGTCYVACLNPEIDGSIGGNRFAVSFPALGLRAEGSCTSGPLYGTPLPGYYPFTGMRGADGAYRIDVDCSNAAQYANHYSPLGAQNVGNFSLRPFGSIAVNKSSSANSITDGSAAYRLEGARYTAYGDEALTRAVAEIVTDEQGIGRTDDVLEPGKYWVRETSAPPGFLLDDRTSVCLVEAEGDHAVSPAPLNLSDDPLVVRADWAVFKVDADTKAASPLGDATLAGARFRLDYYRETFSSLEEATILGARPARTGWTVTDETGRGAFDPSLLASNGTDTGLPLGTLVVTETAAPLGYLLPEQMAAIRPITQQDVAANNGTFPAPTFAENVIRGDIALVKFSEAFGGEDSALKQPLPGVAFNIVLATTGQTMARIVTDETGRASTRALHGNDVSGALPFGTYAVEEDPSTTPKGYRTVKPFSFSFTEDGFCAFFIVENEAGTTVRITKRDAGTGNAIRGFTSFRILDERGDAVSFVDSYPTPRVIDEFTTDENGSCVLPGKLKGTGTYFVQETRAPAGYVLDNAPVAFTLADAAAFDGAIDVALANDPLRGTMCVTKRDRETGAIILASGVSWDVFAAETIVTADGTARAATGAFIGTIETDDAGRATSEPLFPGRYRLVETSAPAGYLIDPEPLSVEICAGSQTEPIATTSIDAFDDAMPPAIATQAAATVDDRASGGDGANAPSPDAGGTLAKTGSNLPNQATLALFTAVATLAILSARGRIR